MDRYDWSRLNHLQVGKYAEYFVKMELTLFGFQVYTSEVDDRCIDFIARRDTGPFFEVQVKSVRGYNYIFVPKGNFDPAPHRILAAVLLHPSQAPELYLIPMTTWLEPSKLFVSRDYEGKKSKPEWGLSVSAANQPLLEPYRSDLIAPLLGLPGRLQSPAI